MKKAFTLIELLVVIAIIAILAAILFPVFAQAKEAAKKTSCLSNTKNIAIGIYLYTGDYDDTYPNTSWEQDTLAKSATAGFAGTYNPQNPNGTYQIHWTYLIQPYIKNWNIFVCPSDPKPFPTDNLCPNGLSDIGKLNSSGQMYCDWSAQSNSYIPIYNAMPAHDWTVVSAGQFSNVANQIVVAEHRNDSLSSTDAGAGDGHKGTSGFFPSQPCGTLNGGTVTLPATPTNSAPAVTAAAGYTTFNLGYVQAALKAAQAAGGIGTSAYVKYFKANDVLRVAYDRHTSGQGANYSFADGHAKYETLGTVLNPNSYQFGDMWYPHAATWNSGSTVQGGTCQ